MSTHAKLSPSGAHRWLVCPGSVTLEAGLVDRGSVYAAEGTAAHFVAAACLSSGADADTWTGVALYVDTSTGTVSVDGVAAETHVFVVDAEMVRSVQRYVDAVRDRGGELHVETRLDYSRYAPGGYGTGDAVVLTDDVLYVDDLKYGRGVAVDAATTDGDALSEGGTDGNPQLLLYALGAYETYSWDYPGITRVAVTVHQPRLDHVSTYETSVTDLYAWAEGVVRPAAERTRTAPDVFVPGEKQCRWCRARGSCRAAATQALDTIVSGFGVVTPPGDLADLPTALVDAGAAPGTALRHEELASLLGRLAPIKSWVDAVGAHAHDLLERGEHVPGYKLVRGRGSRDWRDAERAERALKRKIGAANAYTKKLLSPAQVEKLLGQQDEFVSRWARNVPGKPTIAPESDKRPAIDPLDGFTDVADA